MKDDPVISEEFLNAFVDDQLDETEKSQIFDAIGRDDVLKQRVCELRGLKEQMRHAYEHPPRLNKPEVRQRRLHSFPLKALAACLLLSIGGASGWFAHAWAEMGNKFENSNLSQRLLHNTADAEPQNFIVHVVSSSPTRLKSALDETESLLESPQQSSKKLQVEIIANAGGLDLLRSDASPYAQRVSLMQKKYPNLNLMACGQTIRKLQDEGVQVHLLPNTGVTPSALDQIALRLKQDWSYIKA